MWSKAWVTRQLRLLNVSLTTETRKFFTSLTYSVRICFVDLIVIVLLYNMTMISSIDIENPFTTYMIADAQQHDEKSWSVLRRLKILFSFLKYNDKFNSHREIFYNIHDSWRSTAWWKVLRRSLSIEDLLFSNSNFARALHESPSNISINMLFRLQYSQHQTISDSIKKHHETHGKNSLTNELNRTRKLRLHIR